MSLKGITIPQKYLLSHTLLSHSNLLFVLKEWRQFKQPESPSCFDVIPLNKGDNSFPVR